MKLELFWTKTKTNEMGFHWYGISGAHIRGYDMGAYYKQQNNTRKIAKAKQTSL